jgi:pimeloyl-ACP methyl ester carboxylesterase
MRRINSPARVTLSYDKYGDGPPLVLVHGGFSDHRTNWEFVKPLFERQFTVHAVARRGRGETDATEGHSLEDEGADVAALVESIGEPVFLLGHSYGAQAALAAAAQVPDRVRKLALYEPPWPRLFGGEALARLEGLARDGRWDDFAVTFFRDSLRVPVEELDELRATELWPPIIADAQATLGPAGAEQVRLQSRAFRRAARPRTASGRRREPARPLRHRRPRRRPARRPRRGVARPGARGHDHGTRNVCRSGVTLSAPVGARTLRQTT